MLLLIAAVLRFVPHMPSFSPLFAVLLLSGAHLGRKRALAASFAILALTDLVLTPAIYHVAIGWTQVFVWIGFGFLAVLGVLLRFGLPSKAAAVVAGSTGFFLLANLGVWLGSGMYPHTFQGLVLCYVAALPFYRNALLSTALWTSVLDPAYRLWLRRNASPNTALSGFPA
jgi:hypothetical protein